MQNDSSISGVNDGKKDPKPVKKVNKTKEELNAVRGALLNAENELEQAKNEIHLKITELMEQKKKNQDLIEANVKLLTEKKELTEKFNFSQMEIFKINKDLETLTTKYKTITDELSLLSTEASNIDDLRKKLVKILTFISFDEIKNVAANSNLSNLDKFELINIIININKCLKESSIELDESSSSESVLLTPQLKRSFSGNFVLMGRRLFAPIIGNTQN